MINFRIFIISILISIVFTFIIYNVVDWIAYKNMKRRFHNYCDDTLMAYSSKGLAISQIGVEVVIRIDKSIFFKAKYHALLKAISTTLEQIPYSSLED